MLARYILGVLAVVFIAAGLVRLGSRTLQSRTWLLLGTIFAIVSAWLFYQG